MSVLSEILATKRTEVQRRREQVSLARQQEMAAEAPPARDFTGALRAAAGMALIAEVKKASPSKGVIREDFDPVAIAATYAANGAHCLSVLTDQPYFKGCLNYLTAVTKTVDVPVLRKDFIVDSYQLPESRAAGADAILLIVAALSPRDLRCLITQSEDLGMATLVEVHDRDEMTEALSAGARIIGINNRDLHTFRTSITTTLDLLKDLPADEDRLIVSESGIFTNQDVVRLQEAGVDAVLIGEAFMREQDIAAKMREVMGG